MNAEMLKGHLDNILLSIVEDGPLHGYAIIEAIRRKSDGGFDLPEGTIYPALHRLEVAGLLQSRWVDPPAGRKRRVYEMTCKGSDALREKREGWSKFATAVDALMGKPCPA